MNARYWPCFGFKSKFGVAMVWISVSFRRQSDQIFEFVTPPLSGRCNGLDADIEFMQRCNDGMNDRDERIPAVKLNIQVPAFGAAARSRYIAEPFDASNHRVFEVADGTRKQSVAVCRNSLDVSHRTRQAKARKCVGLLHLCSLAGFHSVFGRCTSDLSGQSSMGACRPPEHRCSFMLPHRMESYLTARRLLSDRATM